MPSGNGAESGSPATTPVISESSSRRSSTVVAIGPYVERSSQSAAGQRPTAPWVGLTPTRPHTDDGMRTDPPPSVAVAIGTRPAASAAPEPPLEPPGVCARSHGLRVTPSSRLSVKPSVANSGRLVLPTITAPARRSSAGTTSSSPAGGASTSSREPLRVGMPATSSKSFTSTGTPCSGPTAAPEARRASSAAASASASSTRRATTDPSAGSRSRIRRTHSSTASTAVARPDAIASAVARTAPGVVTGRRARGGPRAGRGGRSRCPRAGPPAGRGRAARRRRCRRPPRARRP